MKQILVVDDEPLIRKLAINTLKTQGYSILEASNGEDALKIAREQHPDLILLDIRIPGKNGFQVCTDLKSDPATRDIIVILLTGELSEDDMDIGMKAGANDFFTKPFSPLQLMDKIRSALEEGKELAAPVLAEEEVRPISYILQKRRPRTPEELLEMEREQLLIYAEDLGKIYSEEVKKSEELKQAYERIKEMEGMKDVFISLVSHELRTPLSIIKGYINLIDEVLKGMDVGRDLREFVMAILKSSDRLETLVNELLNFSRMKSGIITFAKRELSLPGMLQILAEEFQPEIQAKNQSIEVLTRGEIRDIRVDPEKIKEAFSRLIKNAITFTPPEGKIWLEYSDEGVCVKVKVCDTGVGIPKEEHEKIFAPFYQVGDPLTREVEGMGLGLSIAKHVFEDHGGSITVESEKGKGSTFIVTLPRSYQDAKEIVAELQAKYPQKIEDLSRSLQATEKQLLLYAQDLSNLYTQEKLRSQQLQGTIEELEKTYLQTISALAQAVDVKDSYTGEHTSRVSFYAQSIANALNPELIKQRDFKYSLLLHDIGKIGVGEGILGKAGKLTEAEWEKVKSHPELGAKILAPIKFLSSALSAVRSHHERWDGKGYPDGLKGEEIPLTARIISVADAFDAMTTDRPYRPRMSSEQARAEIISLSGSQFDPGVVRAFEQSWREILRYGRR